MVANFQTFGTVFIGVLTSAATWFMFGKPFLQNDLLEDLTDPNYPLPLPQQQHHMNQNQVGVPETMYPKQSDLYYLRSLPREGDALVLLSANWLPAHQRELTRMREAIESFWHRGLGHLKLAYLPFDRLERQLFNLPTVLVVRNGEVVGKASTKSLLSDYRRINQQLQLQKQETKESAHYLINMNWITSELQLVEYAKKNKRDFYVKAIMALFTLTLSLRLARTRPQLLFGWIKSGVSLFPSPFAS